MKKYLDAAACLTLPAGLVYAQDLNKEQKRLEESGVVMQEVLNIPDNIPHDLLEKAECVIVLSSVKNLAFGNRWRVRSRDGMPDHREVPWSMGAQPCTRGKVAVSASRSAEKRPT